MRTRARWANVPSRGQNMILRDQEYSPAEGTSIWEFAHIMAALQDPAAGFGLFEDFLKVPLDDTTGNPTGWRYQGTGNGQMVLPAGEIGGVIQIKTTGADNSYAGIQLGALNTFEPFVITNASGKIFLAEFRIKAEQHADMGVFIGLAEAGSLAAAFLANDTMIPADKDYIGFRIKADAGAEWDIAWKKAAQAEQEIANAVANADDWHRFGIFFDGLNTVRFYVDRVLNATTALTTAATFPSGEEMSPIVMVKTGEAVLKSALIDYAWVFQAR